jgi:quinol monooxygenase YgiN
LAAKVRKDPGTITYVLNRSTEDPDKFFVFEQYENEEALKYHASTEHFQAYRKEAVDLVKDRDVGFYHEVV